MSTFANSVKRTCAAVCPLYGDVPMGAPGPPGPKGPPGSPVSVTQWFYRFSTVRKLTDLMSQDAWFKFHLTSSRPSLERYCWRVGLYILHTSIH